MAGAYQTAEEIGMIRTMAQGLRELVGRVMIDPDFLAELQRTPEALLAEYELSDAERATVQQALSRLAKTPSSERRHEVRSSLISRVATYAPRPLRPVQASAEALAFLHDVRVFESFSDPDLAALTERLRQRDLRRHQILFREGDRGDEMFIVRRGTILISKAVTGKVEQVLVRVEPFDFFGEMSLFDGSPRSATAQAETDVELLILGRDSLQAMTEAAPRAAAAFFYAMVQVFMERLRRSTLQVAEATRWGLEATGLDVEAR